MCALCLNGVTEDYIMSENQVRYSVKCLPGNPLLPEYTSLRNSESGMFHYVVVTFHVQGSVTSGDVSHNLHSS